MMKGPSDYDKIVRMKGPSDYDKIVLLAGLACKFFFRKVIQRLWELAYSWCIFSRLSLASPHLFFFTYHKHILLILRLEGQIFCYKTNFLLQKLGGAATLAITLHTLNRKWRRYSSCLRFLLQSSALSFCSFEAREGT